MSDNSNFAGGGSCSRWSGAVSVQINRLSLLIILWKQTFAYPSLLMYTDRSLAYSLLSIVANSLLIGVKSSVSQTRRAVAVVSMSSILVSG